MRSALYAFDLLTGVIGEQLHRGMIVSDTDKCSLACTTHASLCTCSCCCISTRSTSSSEHQWSCGNPPSFQLKQYLPGVFRSDHGRRDDVELESSAPVFVRTRSAPCGCPSRELLLICLHRSLHLIVATREVEHVRAGAGRILGDCG